MKDLLLLLLATVLCTLLTKADAFIVPGTPPSLHFLSSSTKAIFMRRNQYGNLILSATTSSLPRDENQKAASLASEQNSGSSSSSSNNNKKNDQEWRDAVIVTSRPACSSGKSTIVEIEIDEVTRQEYTTPGQFVQFRPNDNESVDPIFLAMSSAPTSTDSSTGSNTLQFLIKMSPRLPWLPDTLVVGNTVKISGVMGSGFPLHSLSLDNDDDKATNNGNNHQIIMAAAGSGVAPLKACIESGFLSSNNNQQQTPSMTLYYGEWTEEDLCFTDLYDSWRSALGISVVPVLSRTPDSKGYVQEVMKMQEEQNGRITPAATTSAILCGMDDMVESCSRVLVDLGVDDERILLNL